MLAGLIRGLSLCGLQSYISAPAPVGWSDSALLTHSTVRLSGAAALAVLAYAAVAPFTLTIPHQGLLHSAVSSGKYS